VLFFDQRGAGRSTPPSSLEANTTWHLVADIEKLRSHVGFAAFDLVVGGSWGSTLALAYAQKHPEQVKAMVLWGIFTLRRKEIDWLYGPQAGAGFIRPEAFADYMSLVAEHGKGDPLRAYHSLLTDERADVRVRCRAEGTRRRCAKTAAMPGI
jgi:proline iminopeptidase